MSRLQRSPPRQASVKTYRQSASLKVLYSLWLITIGKMLHIFFNPENIIWSKQSQLDNCWTVNTHLTMNAHLDSVRMRRSLRMCSLWLPLRTSFFLRTLMAKRHFMLLFNCTCHRQKSIDYIIKTWNLEKAAACEDLRHCVWAAWRSILTRSTWPNSPTARVQIIWKSLKVEDERRSGSLSDLLTSKPEVNFYWVFSNHVNCNYCRKYGGNAPHSLFDSWLCWTSWVQSNTNPPMMSLKVLKHRRTWICGNVWIRTAVSVRISVAMLLETL